MQVTALPLLALALLASADATSADSLFDHTRHYTAQSGQEIRIGRHAIWDRKCQSKGEPVVRFLDPPRNGTATTRPGTYTVKQSIGSTNCNGRKVSGLFIYYQSSPDFHGNDQLRYSVDISGQPVVDAITITVH